MICPDDNQPCTFDQSASCYSRCLDAKIREESAKKNLVCPLDGSPCLWKRLSCKVACENILIELQRRSNRQEVRRGFSLRRLLRRR